VLAHAMGASKDGDGRLAAQAVPLMRPLGVVEREEMVQRLLQRPQRGEVVATEGEAPVFMQNRPLQSFDKTVGPRMPRFRALYRIPSGAQTAAKPPLNTFPLSVSTRRSVQPAAR